MGRLDESGWPFTGPGSATSLDKLEELRSRAQIIYDLPGLEREVIMLLAEHFTIRRISTIMAIPPAEVRALLRTTMQRLGIKRHYELHDLVRMTQTVWEPTPAHALYYFVQQNLVGCTVRGAVVQDGDWAGLLLRTPAGESKIAWLVNSRTGDATGCWIQLDDV